MGKRRHRESHHFSQHTNGTSLNQMQVSWILLNSITTLACWETRKSANCDQLLFWTSIKETIKIQGACEISLHKLVPVFQQNKTSFFISLLSFHNPYNWKTWRRIAAVIPSVNVAHAMTLLCHSCTDPSKFQLNNCRIFRNTRYGWIFSHALKIN